MGRIVNKRIQRGYFYTGVNQIKVDRLIANGLETKENVQNRFGKKVSSQAKTMSLAITHESKIKNVYQQPIDHRALKSIDFQST